MPGFHMPWMRKRASPYATVRAMTGIRPADAVLVVGASDAGLAADVALVTGLNGRTLVVDARASAQAGLDAAAADAGALVEFMAAAPAAVPIDGDAFDVVIVLASSLPQMGPPSSVFAEAARLVRPAGRVLVIERVSKAGTRAAAPAAPALAADVVCGLLLGAGLRAPRALADVQGVRFYEGVKPRR